MLLTVLTMKGYAESSNTPEGVTKLEKSRAAINYYLVGDGGKTNQSRGRTAWFNIWVEIVSWVEKSGKRQNLKACVYHTTSTNTMVDERARHDEPHLSAQRVYRNER